MEVLHLAESVRRRGPEGRLLQRPAVRQGCCWANEPRVKASRAVSVRVLIP